MKNQEFVEIPVETHYLEMDSRPDYNLNDITENICFREWKNVDVDEYLKLYLAVGEKWGWSGRRIISKNELEEILTDKNTKIYRLFSNEEICGFVELSIQDSAIEIAYLGLIPKYIGKGIGKMLLKLAIHTAWQHNECKKLWLHTCQYDHKDALTVYLKYGFKVNCKQTDLQYYPKDYLNKKF